MFDKDLFRDYLQFIYKTVYVFPLPSNDFIFSFSVELKQK